MAEPALRRIKSAEARPGRRLAVAWDRGASVVIDFSDMIEKGGVFAPLADASTFNAVRVGENRRVVEWPEPKDDLGYPIIEIDAESLIAKAQQQRDRRDVLSFKKVRDALRNLDPQITRPEKG
jgi:hypothetical protein